MNAVLSRHAVHLSVGCFWVGCTPETAGRDSGESVEPPVVTAEARYTVAVSTESYGEGLTHEDWGGESTGSMELLLDLYEPEGATGPRPAMVLIHGGAFRGGSRDHSGIVDNAEYFAARGWVCASIDYRLEGDLGTVPESWLDDVVAVVPEDRQAQVSAMYPAARDAKAAVRWLHANADRLGVDTNYVTALGGSAGAYLAIMLGTTDAADYRDEISVDEDATLASTHLDQPAEVHTIIDHWGGGTFAELKRLLDGVSRFDETDAPLHIVHGTADPTVPYSEAEALVEAYEGTGVPYALHPLEGAGHGPWAATIDGGSLSDAAYAFILTHQGLVVEE